MRKISGYIAITLLVLAVGVGAWFYVGFDEEQPEPQWSGGEIRVGYSSEPPYAFRADTGEVTGDAPEIAKAVLAQCGIMVSALFPMMIPVVSRHFPALTAMVSSLTAINTTTLAAISSIRPK